MKSRDKLFIFTLLFISSISIAVLLVNRKEVGYRPGLDYETDQAVNQAKALYSQRKKSGFDFTDGPCLTNALLPGWVLDIVHNPRTIDDNLPENQCSAYIQGTSLHFVELDPEGNVVRVR